MIPDEAIEAANIAYRREKGSHVQSLRAALEAAAPYIEKAGYERGWGACFRHHEESTQ